MSFTKRFQTIGSVPLAGEVDIGWDDHSLEPIAEEIRVTLQGDGSMTLRRKDPGYRGELFTGFEAALLEQLGNDGDLQDLYRAAAKRELGDRHMQREFI